jgi:hypothetical protein
MKLVCYPLLSVFVLKGLFLHAQKLTPYNLHKDSSRRYTTSLIRYTVASTGDTTYYIPEGKKDSTKKPQVIRAQDSTYWWVIRKFFVNQFGKWDTEKAVPDSFIMINDFRVSDRGIISVIGQQPDANLTSYTVYDKPYGYYRYSNNGTAVTRDEEILIKGGSGYFTFDRSNYTTLRDVDDRVIIIDPTGVHFNIDASGQDKKMIFSPVVPFPNEHFLFTLDPVSQLYRLFNTGATSLFSPVPGMTDLNFIQYLGNNWFLYKTGDKYKLYNATAPASSPTDQYDNVKTISETIIGLQKGANWFYMTGGKILSVCRDEDDEANNIQDIGFLSGLRDNYLLVKQNKDMIIQTVGKSCASGDQPLANPPLPAEKNVVALSLSPNKYAYYLSYKTGGNQLFLSGFSVDGNKPFKDEIKLKDFTVNTIEIYRVKAFATARFLVVLNSTTPGVRAAMVLTRNGIHFTREFLPAFESMHLPEFGNRFLSLKLKDGNNWMSYDLGLKDSFTEIFGSPKTFVGAFSPIGDAKQPTFYCPFQNANYSTHLLYYTPDY